MWRWLQARFYHWRGDLHRYLGNLHGDREEYRLAVGDFTRAIELSPDFAQAYYDRGLLYWRELGDPQRAVRDLTRFIELKPARAEAWFNRALAFQTLGDAPRAITDYEHYLAVGRDPEWRAISQRRLQDLRSEEREQ
jgi:tetratricopeptide (TPR) repeat protein